MAANSRSRIATTLRSIASDHLYRGSLLLLTNTAALSAFGFAFWTLAARSYPAAAVGSFSGVVAGVGLLAAVGMLGLPNTMIRRLAGTENQRELVMVAVLAVTAVGGVVCLLTVLLIGPLLPAALHLQQRGGMVLLVTALVIITALNSVLDAGLVASRATQAVLIKNVAGNAAKIVALLLFAMLGSSGLLLAYGVGITLALVIGGTALSRRLGGRGMRPSSFRVVRRHLSMTASNYLATVMGILPSTVVPLEVLMLRGPAQTARFAIAFMLAGFLNFIPATTSQVLFAEASRGSVTLGRQLGKALRGVYGLLLPASLLLAAIAPFILSAFGPTYAAEATGPLRVLALSALLSAGNYLVDALLVARDRSTAYVLMNGANAALVLGCVGALLPYGLTGGAAGWALAQGISLILGLLVLATGHTGRHHLAASPAQAPPDARLADWEVAGRGLYLDPDVEPRLQDLLAEWPMMPTTLIAEQIGWDRPTCALLNRVTELRSVYLASDVSASRISYEPGHVVQCGFWFPPVEVPVGFGQVRLGRQLPVLTMVAGYSRWLSAVLIPSRRPEDLFAGWWQLLEELGAVPKVLVWDGDDAAIGRWHAGKFEFTMHCREFLGAVGARVVVCGPGDLEARDLLERTHAYLEGSFLGGRSFASPTDFNGQLADWLADANTRQRRPPNRSPAGLIAADRRAMLPLPHIAPATGWRGSIQLSQASYIRFDANDYSVHPAAIGRHVNLIAGLARVQVVCQGRTAADHERTWAWHQTIDDPGHRAGHRGNPG